MIRKDGFIQMWLESEWDRQAGAQHPQCPAVIGLFSAECLMMRHCTAPWCPFVQHSFLNPEQHTARHFITPIAMSVQNGIAVESFAAHLTFCHLYLFTCVFWWMGAVLRTWKQGGCFEVSHCFGWCMNNCATFVSIYYVKSDTHKVACQGAAV